VTGWATTADCTSITGVTPTDAVLALAQAIIEDHTTRTPDANDSMRLRDLTWLKKAVAWQAAWIPSQPDLLTRMGAKSLSQDGLSWQGRNDVDQFLAPLAQRALKNCSWMGSRSIRTGRRPMRTPEADLAAVTAEVFLRSGADPEYGWDQMGGQ
jgi:hypothetical protein